MRFGVILLTLGAFDTVALVVAAAGDRAVARCPYARNAGPGVPCAAGARGAAAADLGLCGRGRDAKRRAFQWFRRRTASIGAATTVSAFSAGAAAACAAAFGRALRSARAMRTLLEAAGRTPDLDHGRLRRSGRRRLKIQLLPNFFRQDVRWKKRLPRSCSREELPVRPRHDFCRRRLGCRRLDRERIRRPDR